MAEEQAVTANPDIIVHDRSREDKFIMLACDGIWDSYTNTECIKRVSMYIEHPDTFKEMEDLSAPVEILFDETIAPDIDEVAPQSLPTPV